MSKTRFRKQEVQMLRCKIKIEYSSVQTESERKREVIGPTK